MPDLFPRLSLRGVKHVLDDREAFVLLDWRGRRDRLSDHIRTAPTGGVRVTDDRLEEIRARIVDIAAQHGFGGVEADEQTMFDKAAAIAIVEDDLVPSPEALRDDVWAFIAAVLLMDVTNWRWRATAERYRGGVRNAFQRLWIRASGLQQPGADARWEAVEALTEDANLQIFERPGVSASRAVTRMIGEVWLEMSVERPAVPMEPVTREAMRHLVALEQVRPLHALAEAELRETIRAHFQQIRARF